MQKVSQLLSMIISALTLVILLIYIGQSPENSDYMTKEEVKKSIASTQKTIEEKMGEIENINGLDALNEKYTELVTEHENLQKSHDTLVAKVEKLEKEVAKKAKEPVKEPVKEETPKKPEVLQTERVSVISDFLNFRNEASLSAPIRSVLPTGTSMEVLDKNVLEKDGYKWVKVGLDNGEVGYVAREFVN